MPVSKVNPAASGGVRAGPSVEAAPKRGAGRRWGLFAFRAAMTALILTALLTWLPPAELLAAMKKTGILLWTFTVVTHIFAHVVVVAKWRILLDAAGSKPGLVDALRAHGASVFANLYLPSIVGGDVVRAGMVAPQGRNLAAVIAGGLADRVTDCVALILLAIGGLLLLPAGHTDLVRILAISSLTLFAAVFAGTMVIRLVNPERFSSRIARGIAKLKAPMDAMLNRKAATALAFVLSVSIQGFFVLQNIFIANAMGIDVPMAAWFVAWPLAKLASLTPFSLGGLGVREGVLAALLIPFSVAATLSVAQSLVWQTVMYALGMFGGISSFLIGQLRSRRAHALVASRGAGTV